MIRNKLRETQGLWDIANLPKICDGVSDKQVEEQKVRKKLKKQ